MIPGVRHRALEVYYYYYYYYYVIIGSMNIGYDIYQTLPGLELGTCSGHC